jgi:hypothetical protein
MNGKNRKKLLWALTLFVLAGTSALAAGKNDGLSAATHKELARARSATAKSRCRPSRSRRLQLQ